jgi:YidC/Oxa1 family membrane protein insertase
MWDLLILNPMINVLLLIYDYLGDNFGIAIIIFTALIRLVTYPLTASSMRSTQKMQELQGSKKWQDIQKKYKDNKQKLQEEQMKMYQEAGFNPLGGCLPTLIQFPIIIGLYQAIINVMASAPLQLLNLSDRLYAFVSSSLIPLNSRFLWMDLGQPERLPISLPFLPEFGLPVLTILVVISSYFSTKMTTPPSADGQGSQMTQMMGIYMPLLMGYLAYTYASGLALYFVVSNFLGIVQNVAMGRVNLKEMFTFKLPWKNRKQSE